MTDHKRGMSMNLNLIRKPVAGAVALLAIPLAAQAADLPPAAPAYVPTPVYKAPPPVRSNWTGFYIGGHIGEDFTRNASAAVDPADPATATHFGGDLTNGFVTRSFDSSWRGLSGGAQIGYNWQINQFLLGLETDFSGTTAKASQDVITNLPGFASSENTYSAKLDWYGTARARLGVLVNPALLAYGTGGFAYGRVRSQYSFGFPTGAPVEATFADSTNTLGGWTAGGGLEWALGNHLSLRGEYLFLHLSGYGFSTSTTTGFCNSIPALSCNFNITRGGIDEHRLRVGLNYMFN
jgi:outer membrane immunogenic protein